MDDPLFHVTVYSHFFEVKPTREFGIGILLGFTQKYIQYTMGREKHNQGKPVPFKLFGSRYQDYSCFRYHIGQYKEFIEYLARRAVPEYEVSAKAIPLFEGRDIDLKMRDGWELRPYQQEAVDFCLAPTSKTDNYSALVTMPTGTGKGITSLAAAEKIHKRTLVLILPSYITKWATEIHQIMDIDPSRIVTVEGSKQLHSLIYNCMEDELDFDFCIVSIRTLWNYIKSYIEANGGTDIAGIPVAPEKICEVLDVGLMIIDEAHQHLHAVYMALIHTHIAKVIALSATFTSDDFFLENIQKLMFPKEIRFDKIKMKKYIEVYAIGYNFENFRKAKIRTTGWGSNNYSHAAFEDSIMKRSNLLKNYLKLIKDTIDTAFIEKRMSGDKLAVYAATIAMCTHITKYLAETYPYLDVRRYADKDPWTNALEPDIRVTTLQSMGTAVDVPGLRVVLMTNSLSSSVSNLQILGRLRELKDRTPKFYYLYSYQIPKHIQYHKEKKELFRDRVVGVKELRSRVSV